MAGQICVAERLCPPCRIRMPRVRLKRFSTMSVACQPLAWSGTLYLLEYRRVFQHLTKETATGHLVANGNVLELIFRCRPPAQDTLSYRESRPSKLPTDLRCAQFPDVHLAPDAWGRPRRSLPPKRSRDMILAKFVCMRKHPSADLQKVQHDMVATVTVKNVRIRHDSERKVLTDEMAERFARLGAGANINVLVSETS